MNDKIKIGIDASNIRLGGGLAHLIELINNLDLQKHDISSVVVWGSNQLLSSLNSYDWLQKINSSFLNKGFFHRFIWQRFIFPKNSINAKCDILFIPGGIFYGKNIPYVTMCQNMQVFEKTEMNREGISFIWLRLKILQIRQTKTLQGSNGVIFLSKHSKNFIKENYPKLNHLNSIIIPHGVHKVKKKLVHKESLINSKISILYVSTVKQYKHQWNVVEAVYNLREKGYDIDLNLIGGGDKKAINRMYKAINFNEKYKDSIQFHGNIDHIKLLKIYSQNDLFIFSSTCESFGISLVEAMKSGLPIACSSYGPLPEILRDGGIYFDPLSPFSIENSLERLIREKNTRLILSKKARKYSQTYRWKNCSNDTLNFIAKCYQQTRKDK